MKSMRLCRMDFIIQTCRGLFRLGAGGLDYLAQRHDFGPEQLVEGVGGAAGRVYSLARQLVLRMVFAGYSCPDACGTARTPAATARMTAGMRRIMAGSRSNWVS